MKIFENLKNDFPSSIIVFLVAVPLCLGIALASGAPLFSGILAGIVGGLIVGSFSGSSLGVSGPAAGLTVIVLDAINDLGNYEVFLLAVVLAGGIQLLFGFLRAGVIGYYFPSSVIKGMLTGIGLIIMLKQIPHAFGYDADPEGDLGFNQIDGHNTLSTLYYMFQKISFGAIIISVLSLFILVIWEMQFMKKYKIFQMVQGPLVVVVLGIVLNIIFSSFPSLTISSEHLVQLPTFNNLDSFLGSFLFPDFSSLTNTKIYATAVTIAVIASLETLLCVEATDKLDPQRRITPMNTELKAQGIGNIISGLIGGLPVTQVIVRSSANIYSGAKTKLSAILHGVLLLLCATIIPNVLNMIPLSSLAAILLVVGYKLARPSIFKEIYKSGWLQFLPFVITVTSILMTDLLQGIITGMIVAVMNILYTNYKTPYFFDRKKFKEGNEIHINLAEDVTFINKAAILNTIKNIPKGSKVIIDATKNVHIDEDILEIIDDFRVNAVYRDINLSLVGFDDKAHRLKHDEEFRNALKEKNNT